MHIYELSTFLSLCQSHWPTEGMTRHNIIVEGDHLVLTIFSDNRWHSFDLDSSDLAMTPDGLIAEIKRVWND